MHITHCTVHCKTSSSPSLAYLSPAMNVPNPSHSSLLKWAPLQEQLSCCPLCPNSHNLVIPILGLPQISSCLPMTCPKSQCQNASCAVLKSSCRHVPTTPQQHLGSSSHFVIVINTYSWFFWIKQWSQDVVLKLPLSFVCEFPDT